MIDKTTGDGCEALKYETIRWDVGPYLGDSSYKGALFTISGDSGSAARVTLPK